MATRLRVVLVLLGFAVSDSVSCGRPGQDACSAGDHSLLQVDYRGNKHSLNYWARDWASAAEDSARSGRQTPKSKMHSTQERVPVGLVEARGESLSFAAEVENRTLANITKTLEDTLENFSSHIVTLVMGNHKLCAAEGKNGGRVKILMNVLKSEKLLQVGSDRRLEIPEEPSGDIDGLSWVEEPAELGEVQQKDEGLALVQSVGKRGNNDPPGPGLADTVGSALTRTLKSITADVSQEVNGVEGVMDQLQKEEDKLTVLGTELSNRIQVLVSLLQTETQQCPQDPVYAAPQFPFYSAPLPPLLGLALVTSTIHHHRRAPPTSGHNSVKQSVLEAKQVVAESKVDDFEAPQAALQSKAGSGDQASRAHTNSQQGRDKMKMLLNNAQAPESDNITFATLANITKEEMKGLEDNVDALVEEKNKLSVADADGASNLDNLEADLNQKTFPFGMMALLDELSGAVRQAAPTSQPKVQNQEEKKTKIDGNSTAENALADKVTQTAEALADEATKTAELQRKKEKEQVKDQEKKKKKETEKQDTALAASRAASKAYQAQAAATPAPTTPQPSDNDIPIKDIPVDVDAQVKSLEGDVAVLSEEKRQACWASQKVLDRLQVIVGVLSTLDC